MGCKDVVKKRPSFLSVGSDSEICNINSNTHSYETQVVSTNSPPC